ncbi:MAG: FlgO family outer membrane protein [Acidobacteriota bacterium]|nr:FlgO family outer membrane protein [Acidobacteriota bacterium]
MRTVPRRPSSGLWLLLPLLALSLGNSCVTRAESLGEGVDIMARNLASDLEPSAMHSVAVLDFVDTNGETTVFGIVLADELIARLHAAAPGAFTLVERRRLDQVRQEQRQTASRFFDQDSLADVGRVFGADAVIVGTTADLGKTIRIYANAISVETGEVVSTTAVTVPRSKVRSLLDQEPQRPSPSPAGTRSQPEVPTTTGTPSTGSSPPPSGTWTNSFLRITADLVTVQSDGKKANLAVTLTNRTDSPLYLALDKGSYCDFALADNTGSYSRTGSNRITGIACIDGETADQEPTESFTLLSPGSTTTILVKTHFLNAIDGDRLSFSADFLRRHDGKTSSFSAGLPNLPFVREAGEP